MVFVFPAATQWLEGLWAYYRQYTKTPIHTAATASLAIFGLLVFVDPVFAVIAIASYLFPPVLLYVFTDESVRNSEPVREEESVSEDERGQRDQQTTTRRTATEVNTPVSDHSSATTTPARSRETDDGGTDTDTDDGDTDSDTDDGDTDSDTDDGDTDSDTDDGDTDSDTDDGDTDFDSDDGDTDSDSDGDSDRDG